VIRTPDQRLRVFVSSTLGELATERAAVKAAIDRLRLAAVMFEQGARPHPPRALYRAYLEQSHIFLGVYWQSYGWVAPEMEVSGIEDEYELASSLPCLVYIKEPAPRRDPRLSELLARLQREDRVSYKCFETAEQLADLVTDDLALLLAERFEADARPGDRATPWLRPSPLPVPPTRLVGRERDLEALCALIERDEVRLVTLCGVGGIGKTRLALAAATQIGERFADGVGFADLSSVQNPEHVPSAVAAALGIPQEGARPVGELLLERLREARLLLVLDNFEHLLPAAPFVSRLLGGCPEVKVVVTSRALLRLRGEYEFPVTPLEVTPDGTSSAPAVRLFVERAEEHEPRFALEETSAPAVAELCARLEGIPLAIELAAARVRVLPSAALLGRIGERLDLLSGPSDLPARQRTLRATLDWSYQLLDPDERRLLAGLSVFVGGFTLDSARAVCGSAATSDVLEGVSSLIEKSLVLPQQGPAAEPRFRMLETVREYAQDQLERSGKAQETRRRMAEHLARVADQAGTGLMASEHRAWLSRLAAEVDNLRAALSWADANGEPELLLRIATRPWIFWWTRGYIPEMRPLIERCLERSPSLAPTIRVLQLFAVASTRAVTGDIEAAIPVLRQVIDLTRALGDDHLRALAQWQYCALSESESVVDLRAILSEASATLRRLGDRWVATSTVTMLGTLAMYEGDPIEAERFGQEALEEARAIESESATGLVLDQLGHAALARGALGLARQRFADSASAYRRIQDREGLSYTIEGLAAVVLARGRPDLAARAMGAADATRRLIGVGVYPLLQRAVRAPLVAALHAALGAEELDACWRAGAELDTDSAIDELLALTA